MKIYTTKSLNLNCFQIPIRVPRYYHSTIAYLLPPIVLSKQHYNLTPAQPGNPSHFPWSKNTHQYWPITPTFHSTLKTTKVHVRIISTLALKFPTTAAIPWSLGQILANLWQVLFLDVSMNERTEEVPCMNEYMMISCCICKSAVHVWSKCRYLVCWVRLQDLILLFLSILWSLSCLFPGVWYDGWAAN